MADVLKRVRADALSLYLRSALVLTVRIHLTRAGAWRRTYGRTAPVAGNTRLPGGLSIRTGGFELPCLAPIAKCPHRDPLAGRQRVAQSHDVKRLGPVKPHTLATLARQEPCNGSTPIPTRLLRWMRS